MTAGSFFCCCLMGQGNFGLNFGVLPSGVMYVVYAHARFVDRYVAVGRTGARIAGNGWSGTAGGMLHGLCVLAEQGKGRSFPA